MPDNESGLDPITGEGLTGSYYQSADSDAGRAAMATIMRNAPPKASGSWIESQMHDRGFYTPRHHVYEVQPDGSVYLRAQGKWERWKTPILMTGALFGGAFLADKLIGAGAAGGGAGGAGAGAGASGGVGIGETGAVTGLAGSGFGTGGGLGYTGVGAGFGGAGSVLPAHAIGPAYSTLPSGAATTLGPAGGSIGPAIKHGLTGASALDRVIDIGKKIAPGVIGSTLLRNLPDGGGGELPPELREILEMQRQRMQMQQPLYQSIVRMANGRLPTAYQNSQTGSAYDPAAARDAATRRGR